VSVRIYIPTRGRVGFNRQVTLREFLTYSSHKPVLVCPPAEVKLHRAYYPLVLSCPAEGIGPTRQWILENSSADVVVMASDDMRFSYRPDPTKVKLERCEALDPLIALVERCVADGYVHGGVGPRQGNNNKNLNGQRAKGIIDRSHVFVDCERVNDFHFMHREKVLGAGARMDCLPVMEDFHFTLGLLSRGVPNRVIHDYVWNQEGSGKEGGCSLYRTAEVQAQGARGLAAAYPKWVKVVVKKSKDTSPAWKEFKERLDVIVYWWKAYQWARKHCSEAPLLTRVQKECGL
jgi:hypothetical protein